MERKPAKSWQDDLSGNKKPGASEIAANLSGRDLVETNDVEKLSKELKAKLKKVKAGGDKSVRLFNQSLNTLASLERNFVDSDPEQDSYFDNLAKRGLPANRGETPDELLRSAVSHCMKFELGANDMATVIQLRKKAIRTGLALGDINDIEFNDSVGQLANEIIQYFPHNQS